MPQNIQDLYRTTAQLYAARSDLDEAMTERSATPQADQRALQQKDAEIDSLKRRIAHLESRQVADHMKLSECEAQLWDQKVLCNQQATTIKVQSEEIQKGSSKTVRNDTTPSRTNSYTIANPSPYKAAASNVQNNQFVPPGHRYSTSITSGLDQSTSSLGYNRNNVATLGSPELRRNYGTTNLSNMATSSHGSAPYMAAGAHLDMNSSIILPPAPPSTPQPSVVPRNLRDAIVEFKQGSQEEILAKDHASLFNKAVNYALAYCNVPSNSSDAIAPQALKNKLMGAATTTTAFGFIANDATRFWLVTKLILDACYKTIFAAESFSGLDKGLDANIRTQRAKLRDPQVPPAVMYVYLKDIARQYAMLKARPDYNEFMATKMNDRARELYDLVKPLQHGTINGAWTMMYDLVWFAHQVAEGVLLDPALYQ